MSILEKIKSWMPNAKIQAVVRANKHSEQFFADLDRISTELLARIQRSEEEEKEARKIISEEYTTFKKLLSNNGQLHTQKETELEEKIYQGVNIEILMLNFIISTNTHIQKLDQAKKTLIEEKQKVLNSLESIRKILLTLHAIANKESKEEIAESIKQIHTNFEKLKHELKGINYQIQAVLSQTHQKLDQLEHAQKYIDAKKQSAGELASLLNDTKKQIIEKLLSKEDKFETLLSDISTKITSSQTNFDELKIKTDLIRQKLNLK